MGSGIVDGFVLRYNTATSRDGLPEGEGAFLPCSFWLADAYMLIGRHADARHLFERLLELRNDVGGSTNLLVTTLPRPAKIVPELTRPE